MARSAKTRTNKTETPAVIDEAAAISATVDPDPMVDPAPPTGPATSPELEVATIFESSEQEIVIDRLPEPEPQAIAAPPPMPPQPQPTPPTPKVTVQKIGLVPVFLGGIIAASLGYAAAYFGQMGTTDDLTAALAAQTDRVVALEAQVAALPAPPDTAPLSTALSAAQTDISAVQADLAVAVAGLEARLSEVEKAPNADGTLSETAIAAWEREMEGLRTEITAQETRMQEIADAATVQLDQTRIEAATIEQNATDAAAAATARAALSQVLTALDTGAPFGAALGDLSPVVDVPEALSTVAAEGVPSLTALQTDFPDAARAALAVARSEGLAGEDSGGLAGFLRNQFDVRSVTPQEGTTADAILSRAEDALRQNHLSDALAEVSTLPEVVRAEMAGWTSAAETRASALAAVEGLSQSLTQN